MKGFFNELIRLLTFIAGIATCAGSGYLCYIDNKQWGWFLFTGFALIFIGVIWCSFTEEQKR